MSGGDEQGCAEDYGSTGGGKQWTECDWGGPLGESVPSILLNEDGHSGGRLGRGRNVLGDGPDPKWQLGRKLRNVHHRGSYGLKDNPWGCLEEDGWKVVSGGGRPERLLQGSTERCG